MIPIDEKQYNKLKETSDNFKKMSKNFNFTEDAKIKLSENRELLYVEDRGSKYSVRMEEYAKAKINDIIKMM